MHILPLTAQEVEEKLLSIDTLHSKVDAVHAAAIEGTLIRVNLSYAIIDGSELKFKAPADCSDITGLIVYYPGENKDNPVSSTFVFADANGNDLATVNNLFKQDAVVKVILDLDSTKAFIQNADTNAYLEEQLANRAKKSQGVYYIEGSGSSKGTWLGAHSDITEYYSGLTIAYKNDDSSDPGPAGVKLNINNIGNVQVVINNTGLIGSSYPVGSILLLVYTVDGNGTAYWKTAEKDTTNTAGSSDNTGKKMYLIGATSQYSAGTTTYSNSNVYIGTDNCLYSNGEKVATAADLAKKSQGIYYIEGSGSSIDSWKGTHEAITEYYPGLMIAYKNDKAGGTLGDETYLNINNLGSVEIVKNASEIYTDGKRYPVGSIILLVYTVDSDGKAYWKVSDTDTDTQNTAGTSPVSNTKLYLVGSTTQASPGSSRAYATNTNSGVYIGTDNCLYSNGEKVVTTGTGYTKKLLWENADMTSTFSLPQNITLLNLASYDACEIVHGHYGEESGMATTGELPIVSSFGSRDYVVVSMGDAAATIYSDSIMFFAGSSAYTGIKPYKIYGIKYGS